MSDHLRNFSVTLTQNEATAPQAGVSSRHQSIHFSTATDGDYIKGAKRHTAENVSTSPASSKLLVQIEAHFARWATSGATLDINDWIDELNMLVAAVVIDSLDQESRYHLLSLIEIGVKRVLAV